MGSMKDLQIEIMGLTQDWHELIRRILSQGKVGAAYVMRPDEAPDDEERWNELRLVPDLAFTPAGESEPLAVEFKMYRWQSEWQRRLREAVAHMQEILAQGRYQRGIIILSFDVDDQTLAATRSRVAGAIDIWTLQHLRELAGEDKTLAEQLDELAGDTAMDTRSIAPRAETQVLAKGTAIAGILRATLAGTHGWQAFERTCADAVKFLFGRELHRSTSQKRSGEGLHRMDLICRIRSEGNSFWSMIASDFSTRYVVFDAKNYEAPVGQNEIELTKKYLFRGGLRTVAIILAREGASAQARIAAEQALREDQKLILVISMAELCAMLEGADAGDPPENVMFEKVDDMLMRMGR
ncbi:hypothetical protein [Bradyrhizobium sp. SEMIA]|uniref:hypothetical protein n=1 Tax=Bradyrhizobium sp. SEMIA TaxID=2597515 RepID=UPI0018A5AB81|nr:hypothetical protein [Bradyrhizobium sp. SEMIA]QOG23226.1 hypothetical protein FOM02_44245 [Bradyrhizobium sp. SEMIA]